MFFPCSISSSSSSCWRWKWKWKWSVFALLGSVLIDGWWRAAMEGSDEDPKWGRGFNLNAPYFPPASLGSSFPPNQTPGTSSSRQVEVVNAGENRGRWNLWDAGVDSARPRRGPGKRGLKDVSLREWLDDPRRILGLVECLHVFKQVVDLVGIAHDQGVVLSKMRPSCLALSSLHRVSFADSSLCSLSNSGAGSAADSCEVGNASMRDEGESLVRDIGERRREFPIKKILIMETNWYTSPEEVTGGVGSFPSDVYRLGVLLFELFCAFSSPEDKIRTMSNLRHRVLPPELLLKWPKEASFCLWLLHPLPSARPKTNEILKSDFLVGTKNSVEEHETATMLREEIEEEDLLLDFLVHMKERKQEIADKLHDVVCCLSSDIEEVMKKQSDLKEKVGPLQKLDKDIHSESERVDLPLIYPERISDSVEYGSRKRSKSQCIYSDLEGNELLTGALEMDMQMKVKENILSKRSRLMKNFKKLESAYFLTRGRTTKPAGKFHNRKLLSGSFGRGSVVRTEGSSVDNLQHKEPLGLGRNVDWINPFLGGLCKYLAFSKLNARADLKQGDLFGSSNLVCSLAFDRDKELFATAGVNKKIKVFECGSILNDDKDIHYPVVEMSSGSKFSSICWNGYIKSQIASSDFDGIVQVWDVTRSEVIMQMQEHEKRVWSVDFSLADPTKLASGSDDCSVKLWNINQLGSIGTIRTKANVCSVQFRPDSGRSVAIGSADHRVYCYDLRNVKTPWCTLIGHSKTVSYVKYVDPNTLVSASTDNTVKLWDLSSGASTVLDEPLQTFTGHTNVKNFVGLSVHDGYIATGSETNEVYVYHKAFPMPMLSLKFDDLDPISGRGMDDMAQFVSCVCWRGQSNTLVAANSSGNIKLLEMV